HAVDIRADIYSLGCTLYYLLASTSPFSSHDTYGKKMQAHQHEPPPPIQHVRADVPDAMAAVLERMMAKQPEKRYGTPAEVAAALAAFVADPQASVGEVAGVPAVKRHSSPTTEASATDKSGPTVVRCDLPNDTAVTVAVQHGTAAPKKLTVTVSEQKARRSRRRRLTIRVAVAFAVF